MTDWEGLDGASCGCKDADCLSQFTKREKDVREWRRRWACISLPDRHEALIGYLDKYGTWKPDYDESELGGEDELAPHIRDAMIDDHFQFQVMEGDKKVIVKQHKSCFQFLTAQLLNE